MKKTAVFVHGLFGTRTDWDPVTALLPAYNCVAIDLPSHGDCHDHLEVPSLENLAHWLKNKLERLSLHTPCHFVGYSLGGRVLLALHRECPKLFEKLILISSSPGLLDPQERQERQAKDAQWTKLFVDLPRQDFFRRWYDQDVFKGFRDRPDLLKKMIEERALKVNDKAVAYLTASSPGINEPMWANIKNISNALWLAGSRDDKYVGLGKSVVAENPKVELKIIENAGHAPHIEKQGIEIAAIIDAFLGVDK